jgi:imidazolonepropionase-like amidohydrolase
MVAIGNDLSLPDGGVIVNAKGKWVIPGIIDVHSHLGVYPAHGGTAHSDGNEASNPVTAEVWTEHSIWPQDAGFQRALSGGIPVMQILPGSTNLVGGRGVTVKNLPGITVQDMKFPDAPYGMKVACGENLKRIYGKQGLAALTINVAKLYGIDDNLGSLEVGKHADVVIWTGDPLEVTESAELVLIAGEIIEMHSRQSKLRDRYLQLQTGKRMQYVRP